MHIDNLPPLRDVITQHDLAAKKSLGQNFLFDLNLTRRIARAAAPLDNTTIIEVGPGPGGLTRALLLEGASHVIAIERDDRAIAALADLVEASENRLHLISGDALSQDWSSLVTGPTKIVANLPYNIATPLLTGWLTQKIWPPWFQSLTLMFQKEVAERIVAKPGTDAYGRLSVLCQWRCTAVKLFDVNRAAFTPPPKVTSSVVQLTPLPPRLPDIAIGSLERVTAAAFGQRRKMLRSSLKSIFDDPTTKLASIGINAEKRAEELSIEQFANIAALMERP